MGIYTENIFKMNLEREKENFKNHIATFTDYGNIKILDFKEPNSSHYRIRFLFEEDYYRLHISGDLGQLIATNYCNMTFEKFDDFVNNTGYFEEKIDCHDRALYIYDEEETRKDLKKYIEDNYLLNCITDSCFYEDDDEKMEDFLNSILSDFSYDTGIGHDGYKALCEVDSGAWEYVYSLGKKETGILDLYMLAFKLAMEQLNKENK